MRGHLMGGEVNTLEHPEKEVSHESPAAGTQEAYSCIIQLSEQGEHNVQEGHIRVLQQHERIRASHVKAESGPDTQRIREEVQDLDKGRKASTRTLPETLVRNLDVLDNKLPGRRGKAERETAALEHKPDNVLCEKVRRRDEEVLGRHGTTILIDT